VFTGVAVAAAGTGVVFLVRRSHAIDEQERHCVGAVCNADFRDRVTDAESKEETRSTLAVAAFSLSAVALGTAITLWLTDDRSADTGLASVTVASRDSGVGVSLGGRF
jgi:hypothetical protein